MLLAYQKEFHFCRSWEDLSRVTLDQFLIMSYAFRKINAVDEDDKSKPSAPAIPERERSRAEQLLEVIPAEMQPVPPPSESGRMVVIEGADETMAMVRAIRDRHRQPGRAPAQGAR